MGVEPAMWDTVTNTLRYFLTCWINAGDIIAGQNLVAVAQAEEEVCLFIPLAALRLTVAAVQLHFDFTFAVTFHGLG